MQASATLGPNSPSAPTSNHPSTGTSNNAALPTFENAATPVAQPSVMTPMNAAGVTVQSSSLLGTAICSRAILTSCYSAAGIPPIGNFGNYWGAGYMDQYLDGNAAANSAMIHVAFPQTSSPSNFLSSGYYLAAGMVVQSQDNGVGQDYANFAMVYFTSSGAPVVLGEVWNLPDGQGPQNGQLFALPSFIWGATWPCSCLSGMTTLEMVWNPTTHNLDYYATIGSTRTYLFTYTPITSTAQRFFHVGITTQSFGCFLGICASTIQSDYFQWGVMSNQSPGSGWNAYVSNPEYTDLNNNLHQVQTAKWVYQSSSNFDWEYYIGGNNPNYGGNGCKNRGTFPGPFGNSPLVPNEMIINTSHTSSQDDIMWDNTCSPASQPTASFLDSTTNPTGNTPTDSSWQNADFQTTLAFSYATVYAQSCTYSVESWNGNNWVTTQSPTGATCAPGAPCCTGPTITVSSSGNCNFFGYRTCRVNIWVVDYMGNVGSNTRYFSIWGPGYVPYQMSSNPATVNMGSVGTGSTQQSTITFTAQPGFTGTINLATSVSPVVTNGPSASLSTVTVTQTIQGDAVLSPSSLGTLTNNPSNPTYAFSPDQQYAGFDSNSGGAGAITSAVYTGYSASTLRSPPTITKVTVKVTHYESTYGRVAGNVFMDVMSGSQSSGYLYPPYRISATTDTFDVTGLVSGGWTPNAINNVAIFYGDQGGYFISHLDYVALDVQYTFLQTYTTSSVTFTNGGTDTRVLTISDTSSTSTGTYTVGVTGTSGTISLVAPVIANVQDFALTLPSTAANLVGRTAIIPVTVSAISGFVGTVSLSNTTPSGLTCSWNPSSISLTASSQIATSILSCNGPPGVYPIPVTASSGTLSHTGQVTLSIQDFTITANPSSLIIQAGTTGNATITISPLDGFMSPVSLSNSTSSSALTCNLWPSVLVLGTGTSNLSCSGSAGAYTVTITAAAGPNGTLTHSVTLNFNIQDFSISASPTSVTVNAGWSGSSTITISALSGFSGTVNLSVASSPSTGLTCSLTQSSVTGSGTSVLGCFGSAGVYTVTVTGNSGTLSHAVTVRYTVWDFAISASPTSVTGLASATLTSMISTSSLGGFPGTITLTMSIVNSPSGFTCSLSPASVTVGGSSTLSCSGVYGSYTVTVTGSIGSCNTADTCNKVTHSINLSFQIQDFSISSPSSTVPVLVGQTGTATLTIASLNGFTGTVSLSDTPLPSGLTCNPISPISITLPPSPASATLSCSATSVGTYTVTILASSGSLSHTATVTFTVQDYTISISPTSETIIGSNTGASTVTITPVNGFANIVSLTASPSPSGLYCYFSPNTITGSGTATMYCYGSAGTYTVTITGAVGTFTHFATATITVRDFSISASPSSISIPDGRSGSLTVQATSLNGYTGTIVLGVSNLYCGTQSFSKPSIQLTSGGSNTSILTLNIGSNCNASQYNAYVTGYDSSAQVSRAGSLIVNTSDFSIVGQVGTTVGIGGQTTLKYNVTYYDNNNYPGSILTQTNSFGVNNCCLSTTIPTTFSIARPDSNSAPGLVTSLNIQTQSFSDPWNGQGFYAQGRDWIFFIYYGTCSGTTTNCLYYATSTNGAAWTIYNTGLVTGSTPSIVTNGTAVYYVRYNGVDTQSGKALMLGVGTLHTDGTIAWQPEKTVKPATSGVFWYAMSMRVSTTGQVFVAYNKLTSAYGSGYPYVIHSNGVDYTTWQQDTSLINSNDDWRFSLVPLSNGQMYILYWPYWGGLNGRLWSSGAWGSQVTVTPSNTYVQQTAFGFSNGNSTVYAIWQERTSQKIQFATRTSSWSAPQTIFTADTGSNPRWTASYDPLHAKWYILYYSYSTNQIWEYSGQPGSWSGKTVLYTTTGASSNTMIGSFYNSGQVNSSTNTLGIFWTQYDSSLTTLQLKFANATIFTGGSFPSTWPITSTGAGSGATTLTVTASDGYITRSLTLQLTINGYNVTYYYNPLPVNQGSSTAIYLQIFPEYGIPLTQATVSPVTVPSCITVSPPNPQFFNIGPIGGYDFPTVPVAASSTCTVGSYQVTVKINGTSVHTYDKLLTFTVVVATPPPSGGGGGSVAAGTLITLADGSQVPVQSLKVGMQLLSYNMTTRQYTTITITRFVTVQTNNLMIIHTSTGKPLIVDQNPAQKLEVMFPNGTWTELSVTQLQVGDYLFDATTQTWVPVTSIQYEKGGAHIMYDIYTDAPTLNYIANDYLDYVKV